MRPASVFQTGQNQGLGSLAGLRPTAAEVQVAASPDNFIAKIIVADIENRTFDRQICLRFPPEPNGYMHLGHAKALSVGLGLANRFTGLFNLRLDDTNPLAERSEYVQAMIDDVEWLVGFKMTERIFHASDYFNKLIDYARELIVKGHAFVDDLSLEQVKEYRGDFHIAGRPSPYRERSVEENLQLFDKMCAGEFKPGEKSLRAKIDPNHPNVLMRDPVIYRILDADHHRVGRYHVYPLYDYAHPLSDAIEGITHSTCGKEFVNHGPLYRWFLEKLEIPQPPKQVEFAEVEIEGIVLAKRHLRKLVEGEVVHGWDDPRLPTIRGMRRLGYPAEAILEFCESLGVSNNNPGRVAGNRLHEAIRTNLNKNSPRFMGVLNPLKVVIENIPAEDKTIVEAVNNPGNPLSGSRSLNLGREIFIDRTDFTEEPVKGWHRLAPDAEVRLRYGYVMKCTGILKNPETGEILELRATVDKDTLGKNPEGRKVKGTIQWVSAEDAVTVECRLYEALFQPNITEFTGSEGQDLLTYLNPNSLKIVSNALVEPSVATLPAGKTIQLERVGYFCVDPDSSPDKLVLNRTVTLNDTTFRKETAS